MPNVRGKSVMTGMGLEGSIVAGMEHIYIWSSYGGRVILFDV